MATLESNDYKLEKSTGIKIYFLIKLFFIIPGNPLKINRGSPFPVRIRELTSSSYLSYCKIPRLPVDCFDQTKNLSLHKRKQSIG